MSAVISDSTITVAISALLDMRGYLRLSLQKEWSEYCETWLESVNSAIAELQDALELRQNNEN